MDTYHSQRGMIAPLAIAVVLVAAAAVGAYYASRPQGGAMMEKTPEAMMEKTPEAMMEKTPEAMMSPTAAQMVAEFSMAGYTNAVKTGKLAVLYYYANWCPVCKAEFPTFQATIRDLNESRVASFRVNYNDSDTDSEETAAAKTFQVGYQHTLVIVKNGNLAFKGSVAGWTQEQFTEKIREFLP